MKKLSVFVQYLHITLYLYVLLGALCLRVDIAVDKTLR